MIRTIETIYITVLVSLVIFVSLKIGDLEPIKIEHKKTKAATLFTIVSTEEFPNGKRN